jgi:hypothetical protein
VNLLKKKKLYFEFRLELIPNLHLLLLLLLLLLSVVLEL